MFVTIRALAVAFIAGDLALAAPRPLVSRSPGKFTIDLVKNENFVRSGVLEIAKTHIKFGKAVPDKVRRAVDKRQSTGSVTATPQPFDLEYLCPVSIGTPPQVVNLDFDTGSADLWVAGTVVAALSGQTPYEPASSTTSVLTANVWTITYGDGSFAGGTVYKDVVEIGGVSYASQAVEVAAVEAAQFLENANTSGLVGLAFSSINQVLPQQQLTFFDNVKASLDEPLFAANLKHNTPGSYDFGFADSSAYTGSLVYTPVDDSDGFWSFSTSGYQIGSDTASSTPITGIADTGTTLLYLPTDIVEAYYSEIEGAEDSSSAGGWVFPCDATIPSFTYIVEGTSFTIPAEYVNYAPVGDGTCYGGIQDDSSIGFAIFGDMALKVAYVVFDSEQPQLGWATKDL